MVGIVLERSCTKFSGYGIKPEFLPINYRWVSLALARVQQVSSSAASGSKLQQEHFQRAKTKNDVITFSVCSYPFNWRD